ncbi:MAG: TolC family protein [Gammaproteobacteria bacterium]|nr:TolC family protein [Gammaproteobacteria bacterium]
MLSKSKIYFFSCSLLLFSSVLPAETSVHDQYLNIGTQTINLRQAISKTFAHNPALKSFSYELKAQQGRVLQARMSASPEFNLVIEDVSGSGNYKSTDSAQITMNIGWVLEGEIRQRFIDEAQAEALSLSTETTIKRLDVAAETARLYLICLAKQANLINADKTVALASRTVIAVDKRVNSGKTPDAELARARAELARKRLDRENITYQLSSAIRLLAAQWGEVKPRFNKVEGDIFNTPPSLTFETLKQRLQQSPDFLRLLSDKRLKQAQLKLAQSKSKPEWKLNLGVRHYEQTNDQALVAGISFPFGERSRNTGRIRTAQENLSQTQALQDELNVRLETTLFVLTEKLQHSLHRVETYRKEIIPRLETALTQTRRAYDLGRYSYLEWRSVQAELLNARTSLIEDSIAAHLKVIEIERLTGVSMTQPAGKKL